MPVLALLYEKEYNLVKNSDKIVVIHFYAVWAEQCSYMNNLLTEMSSNDKYKDVIFAMITAEQFPQISMNHKIDAVPTIIFLSGGKEVDRVDGANPNLLTSKLTQLLSTHKKTPASPEIKSSPPSGDVSIEERIKSLINAAPVMLFMKGNTEQPRCGFSRKIVEILKDHSAEFKTFDILNNQEVRENLKKFSNWPTYPQLYVKGELIGGLDIVKELVESGELKEMLPKSKSIPMEDRLKSLISKSKVMVFLKGNRSQPKCGFSRQLIEILNNSGSQYETFDILEDEDVRQGLKKFSNWPTYPQVYVNGDLVGGLDIIKEHVENGELKSMLTA